MGKDIYIAQNKNKAIRLSGNESEGISLEEEVIPRFIWDKINSDKIIYPNIWKIVKEFYGPKGDFVINFKNISFLKKEIKVLRNKIEKDKSKKQIIDFLNSLLSLCKKAEKDKLNMYGFAD